MAYFRYSYFVINTSYHDIAAINSSERELHICFFSVIYSRKATNLFMVVYRLLGNYWIAFITMKLHMIIRVFGYIPGEYSNTKKPLFV